MNEIEVSLLQTTNEIGVNITHGDTPPYYVEKSINSNKTLINANTMIDLRGIEDIDAYVLAYAYTNSNITGNIDMSPIKKLTNHYSCEYMFQSAHIDSVDLSGLEIVSGISVFYGFCMNSTLKSVNLSKLKTITGNGRSSSAFSNAFYGTQLTEVSFDSLEEILSMTGSAFTSAFFNCRQLKQVNFPKLKVIEYLLNDSYGQMFGNCYALESVLFGGVKASTFTSRTNQFRFLFNASTGQNAENGCTVHFPSNFDPENPNKTFDITTLDGYPTFNGNSSYIHLAYDLPATE